MNTIPTAKKEKLNNVLQNKAHLADGEWVYDKEAKDYILKDYSGKVIDNFIHNSPGDRRYRQERVVNPVHHIAARDPVNSYPPTYTTTNAPTTPRHYSNTYDPHYTHTSYVKPETPTYQGKQYVLKDVAYVLETVSSPTPGKPINTCGNLVDRFERPSSH